ncbi:hypothetical protein PCL_06330 [Purpureocillium lilacinum]|uniref:F-box domain-containing protein n=1 Tax=Purpureocillium lilacinum TaxID=33203 RepID=A0A2U3EMH3_PURLI|nr:hypothetical protein PCL_06330 [Purpureocillium lilacinum]
MSSNGRFTASLPGLLVELQLMICAQLCCHCQGVVPDNTSEHIANRNALIALSATSRQMRAVAQPFIYHYVPGSLSGRHLRLWPFIRTIRSRPDLAASVRWLGGNTKQEFVDSDGFRQCMGIDHDPQLHLDEDSNFNAITEYAEEISSMEIVDPWLLDKFVMGVILSMLARLEMLEFSISLDFSDRKSFYRGCWLLDSRFSRLGKTLRLGSLRALKVNVEKYWLAMPCISALLRGAPNLEQLLFKSCQGFWQGSFSDHDTAALKPYNPLGIRVQVPIMGNLRSLAFDEAALRDDDEWSDFEFLKGMIEQCPRLEQFQFKALRPVPDHNLTDEAPDIGHHRLVSAALPARETLKVLDLNIGSCWNRYTGAYLDEDGQVVEAYTPPDIGPILAQFSRLEVLKLDEAAFCRHQNPNGNDYDSGDDSDSDSSDSDSELDPGDPDKSNEPEKPTCIADILPLTVKRLHVRLVRGSRAWEDAAYLATAVANGEFPALSAVRVDAQPLRQAPKLDFEKWDSIGANTDKTIKWLHDLYSRVDVSLETNAVSRWDLYEIDAWGEETVYLDQEPLTQVLEDLR